MKDTHKGKVTLVAHLVKDILVKDTLHKGIIGSTPCGGRQRAVIWTNHGAQPFPDQQINQLTKGFDDL